MDILKQFVYVNIISADNDEFGLTEDQKQEIISRYRDNQDNPDWAYILECMPEEYKQKLIDFFNDKSEADEEPIQDKTLESGKESPKEC